MPHLMQVEVALNELRAERIVVLRVVKLTLTEIETLWKYSKLDPNGQESVECEYTLQQIAS